MGAPKTEAEYPPIPDDWGLPGWSDERFKAFNDGRRRLHELMKSWDEFLIGKRTVLGKD